MNLWNQNIGLVPDHVFDQTDLTSLILAGNALTDAPESRSCLVYL
jgi:hypothetical protein